MEAGATVLDASVGGTGGCPFAPAATGNVATEDLVYAMHGMGHETGIDLEALIEHCSLAVRERSAKNFPARSTRPGTFEPVAG